MDGWREVDKLTSAIIMVMKALKPAEAVVTETYSNRVVTEGLFEQVIWKPRPEEKEWAMQRFRVKSYGQKKY